MIAASVIKWTKPRECFLFCSCYILFSSTIHQNFTKEKSWSWQYLDITSLLTGWESFHRRNNSFREHNTLFGNHVRFTHTVWPMRNTAEPYDTTTQLSPINKLTTPSMELFRANDETTCTCNCYSEIPFINLICGPLDFISGINNQLMFEIVTGAIWKNILSKS